MRIVIAGCGRVGSDLALATSEKGHDVSVIDHRAGAFRRLGTTFNGATHEGGAYDLRVLRAAGIEFADSFVAVTDNDNANVMAVQLAKQVFGVPHAVARLGDPTRAEAYRALDVDYVAGSKLESNVLHELIVEREFSYHVTFSGGNVEIVEMVMSEAAEGMIVERLEIEDSLRVAAVRREDRTYIPGPGFVLQANDLVVAAARSGARSKVKKYLIRGENR